jgi:RNA polymerase sigma-70 factor (ECF subfamily)
MAKWAAGSSSFDALYARELPGLVALGLALTGSRESAKDIAQEALLRAYRDWDRVTALDRPGAWVRRVLINLATDTRRRRTTEVRAMSQVAAEPAAITGEPELDRFWDLVRALPERQRAAVALRYVDDLAVDDIAAILRVSVGTITKSLFEARRSLAGSLGLEVDDDRR